MESILTLIYNIIIIIKHICKKYNALTYIDEVHAVGLYGKEGAGIIAQYNLEDDIDIIQGTFAKAYGVIGGYVVSSNNIIDAISTFERSNLDGLLINNSLFVYK